MAGMTESVSGRTPTRTVLDCAVCPLTGSGRRSVKDDSAVPQTALESETGDWGRGHLLV